MQKKKSFQEFPIYYIVEAALNPGDMKTEILHESTFEGADGRIIKTVTADSTLQTFNVINWNSRIYPDRVVMQGLDSDPKIQNDIRNKQFCGEFCHPDSKELSRQSQIISPLVSHYILNYRKEGDRLMAHVKTTPYGHGLDMYNILMAGHPWGFSLRAFGGVDSNNVAMSPLRIITYDQVNRPSHKTAYATSSNIIQESASIDDERKMLQETSLMYAIESSTIQQELTNFVLESSDNVKIAQELFGLQESVGVFNDKQQVVLEGTYMGSAVQVFVPVESYVRQSYSRLLGDIRKMK